MPRPFESTPKRNRLRKVKSGLFTPSKTSHSVHSEELLSPSKAKSMIRIWLKSPWDDYYSVQQLNRCVLARHKTRYFMMANIKQLDCQDVLELSHVLCAIQHPNVASMYDIYSHGGQTFLVAEHLYICISDLGLQIYNLVEWEIATIFSEVLKGIAHIASLKLSCKNISSEHIRLSLDGEVKIAIDQDCIKHDPLYQSPRISQVLLDFPILAEIIEEMMLPRYHLTSDDDSWSEDALGFLSCALSGTLESLMNHRFLNQAVSPRRLIPRIRYAYLTSQSEISYNNGEWKAGDWVYVPGGSDSTEPIVAQINRIWEDAEGQKWFGGFLHQANHDDDSKSLHRSEAVPAGPYRDYKLEQIVGRCIIGTDHSEHFADNDVYSSSD